MSKRTADEAGIPSSSTPAKKQGWGTSSTSAAHDLINSVSSTDFTHNLSDEQKRMLKPRVERLEVLVGPERKRFVTSRETLTSITTSQLAAFFTKDGPEEAKIGDTGAYLLPQRSAEHFMFILNYLRDREIDPPTDLEKRAQIEEEARFYGLPELVKLLTESAPAASVTVALIVTGRVELDGKDSTKDCAALTHDTEFPNNQSFSVVLWLNVQKKPTKAQARIPIYHKGDCKDQLTSSVFLTDQKKLLVCTSNQIDADTNLMSDGVVDPKSDTHIAVVFDVATETCSLYLNGSIDSSVSFKKPLTPGKGTLKIGWTDAFGKGKVGFAGSIWSMSVHHAALKPEEVLAFMKQSTRAE